MCVVAVEIQFIDLSSSGPSKTQELFVLSALEFEMYS
jgi:hypothetical protein